MAAALRDIMNGITSGINHNIINFRRLQAGEGNNEFFCDNEQGANAMILEAV